MGAQQFTHYATSAYPYPVCYIKKRNRTRINKGNRTRVARMIAQWFVQYATAAYPYPQWYINKTEKSILYSRILKSQFDLLPEGL